jgi:hypothetical protein
MGYSGTILFPGHHRGNLISRPGVIKIKKITSHMSLKRRPWILLPEEALSLSRGKIITA